MRWDEFTAAGSGLAKLAQERFEPADRAAPASRSRSATGAGRPAW
jgi:hypothetical protein